MANKKGKRGHPCHVPLAKESVDEITPGIFNLAVGTEYIERIVCRNGPLKPIISRVLNMNSPQKPFLHINLGSGWEFVSYWLPLLSQ